MTDTADLVKRVRDLLGDPTEGYSTPLAMQRSYMAQYWEQYTPKLLTALSSTQARADKLEAELVEAKREIERLRENHRVAVHRKRVTGEYRDDFKARAEAAEARAAAMREALCNLLPWLEDAETKCLVGDEGCVWAVEFVRQAIGERPCPRPIAGNKSGSARECIALGQCGCDEREIAARALQEE